MRMLGQARCASCLRSVPESLNLDSGTLLNQTRRESSMKSLLLLTATGPLLVLTSHESLHDPKLLGALKARELASLLPSRFRSCSPRSATAGIFKWSKTIFMKPTICECSTSTASGSFSFFVSTNWGGRFCRSTFEVPGDPDHNMLSSHR